MLKYQSDCVPKLMKNERYTHVSKNIYQKCSNATVLFETSFCTNLLLSK